MGQWSQEAIWQHRSPGPSAGLSVAGVGRRYLSHRCSSAGLTLWHLPSSRLPAPAGPATGRPGTSTEVAGLLPCSAQCGAGPCGEPGSGPGELGAFCLPLPIMVPSSPHTQEGRLVEKESSEWQLQGQPTVLLTLAHIFHRFAPLLVRGHWGGGGAGRGRGACARVCAAPVGELCTFAWQGPRVARALTPHTLTQQRRRCFQLSI